jgi:hypothetical protein
MLKIENKKRNFYKFIFYVLFIISVNLGLPIRVWRVRSEFYDIEMCR